VKALWIVLAILAAGCTSQVGDACENGTQCGPQLDCDLTQPDGYCTKSPCEINGCPEPGECIRFDDDSTFCMAHCESSDDCRDNYVCVTNYGDVSFCNSAPYLGN
jgi:hypothetical protein